MWGGSIRLSAQISAHRKQGVNAEPEDIGSSLKAFLESQISELEQRIEGVIAEAKLDRMTATEAAAMTGLTPMAHDSGAMRGKRVISGGRRSLRHVLFQAGLAATCHNPVLKAVSRRMKEQVKPHTPVLSLAYL